MLKKLLIANRGEIACRIIKTARTMGIKTVAVFSDADRHAMHVTMADEAYHIGPAPSSESYLQMDVVLEVAEKSGADAIHPGYGFLSENAAFARKCEDAGIKFVGPRPETIDVMGSKAKAKDLMEQAGVPTLPGYQGADQSLDVFEKEADRIGYPVLLKATAGGGGKGMRIVRDAASLKEALESAKREALSAFGDDRFLIEKFVEAPRHIEVQVFGDEAGNVVHLYERDCSVQRRYQKVVEEAPAPNLPEKVRDQLHDAGVEAARAVNYVGAGTVEFLYDGDEGIYFMEMNTRLQVEHPVTEKVTGFDLVEWQLRVAAGEQLPVGQDQVYCDGHAIEVRLYAEVPEQDFRPSVGPVDTFDVPISDGIRVDTGIQSGGEITPFYDPMIAKVIATGEDRTQAVSRLADALLGMQVSPLETNQAFLWRILTHTDFMQGGVTTHFLETYSDLKSSPAVTDEELALATLLAKLPDHSIGPWRMNMPSRLTAHTLRDGDVCGIKLLGVSGNWMVTLGDRVLDIQNVQRSSDGRHISGVIDGKVWSLTAVGQTNGYDVRIAGLGGPSKIEFIEPGELASGGDADGASLVSPMPATVTNILVQAGAAVEEGQVIMTLEAMKMEHLVKAPSSGTVTEILYTVGDTVGDGARLISFEANG